jgi:hypothetical protein
VSVKNKPWTPARFHSFITSGLRALWQKWPAKYQVRKAANRERGIYLCAGYKKRKHKVTATIVNEKGKRVNNVFVDHIAPVIDPAVGFVSWDEVVNRMFVEPAALQILCLDCHSRKTKDERDLRVSRDKD